MGFDSELRRLFGFVYRTELEDGLVEYEYDHVLLGQFDGTPNPDENEVCEWRWTDLQVVSTNLDERPESYTYWFRLSFCRFLESLIGCEE